MPLLDRYQRLKQQLPGLARQRLDQAELTAERTVAWVSNAIERRTRTENFIVADQTPYDVIHENGLLTVRCYRPLTEDCIPVDDTVMQVRPKRHRVPVLLVPPLAADPLNFDLLPHRSLVRYLLASGFKVYLADFGSPELDHSHLGLADYATKMLPEAIAQVRKHARVKDLSLLGYCMGGLFCLVHAGWAQDPKLKNIVTIASPIDAHQAGVGGQLLSAMRMPIQLVRRYTSFRIHNLDPKKLQIPGWMSSLAFKMTNPMGTVNGYIDLLMNLWDRDYVIQHQTMATWFNQMHAYPGGIVQDFLVNVGMNNALSTGRIEMAGGIASQLDGITAAVLAIAGTSDKIVTVEAARRIMDTLKASRDKQFELAPGGHAGVFAGSRAPGTTWKITAEWLAARSR